LSNAGQSDVFMPIHPEWICEVWHKQKWYYSVTDIVAGLLDKDTRQGSTYWRKPLAGQSNERAARHGFGDRKTAAARIHLKIVGVCG
jgi:hypothetical protein